MHRSGTSAYAGVLNKLGISFGKTLMEAKEDNERGFFENQLIYEINESILKAINSSWDDVFPLKAYWWKQQVLSTYRERIIEVFDKEFEGAELFGIKDPRICILFPYWQNILKDMQISPSFVIPIRHPFEVAQSLEKRNGLPIRTGISLWMKYMIDAEYHSRGFNRIFVSFDKLLSNTEDTNCHIANTVGLNFLGKWEDEQRAIGDFLELGIKHHCCEDDTVNHPVPQYIGDYYRVLLNIVGQSAVGDIDQFRMDTFRKRHLDELRAISLHHNSMSIQNASETIVIGGVNSREMEKVRSETPMEVEQVSIVVVNYNGRKYLEPLFNSLLSMDRDNVRLEIIMVDNLSADDSVSFVKGMFPEVRIVENDVNNFARALNLGIEHAGGDYIAFLNNDAVVDRKWLEGLLAVMARDEKIGAVQSKILFADRKTINSVGVEEEEHFYFKDIGFNERDHGQYEMAREMAYYTGGSVLLRRACIDCVGRVDEDFILFFEDVDYGIRCKKAGWKIFYAPESVVYHKYHGMASMELASYFSSRNRLLCLAKHFPLKLSDSIKTSKFYLNNQQENLYQSLIQAARKLIAENSAATSLNVFAEIKDVLIEIYGTEKTKLFFSQVEVLTGLKQIKMGIYDHALKCRDGEEADQLDIKPSYYLGMVAGPMYMAAELNRPVLAIFNQVDQVISLLQKTEQNRKACLLQIVELNRVLAEKDKQVHSLTEWATGAEAYAKTLAESSAVERVEATKQVQSLSEWATGADAYAKSLEAEVARLGSACKAYEAEVARLGSACKAHEAEIAILKGQLSRIQSHWLFKLKNFIDRSGE
jgi:GT2 family glycosyltransferase